MRTRTARLLLLFLLATSLHGAGQSSSGSSEKPFAKLPAEERKLIAIKVTGSKRYPENAIAAASGLQIGTPVTEEDFKKAARRLGDMGIFTDIAYNFSYSSAGTKLELHVTDGQRFVPARFEDFVWFSDAEIMRRIKDHVPLFDGSLPLNGHMADEVSDVLQAMLVEGAIPGHVGFVRAGKEDGPVEAIVYQVSDVLIRVRNFEFAGADAAELPALEAAGQRFSPRQYSRTRLENFAQHQLLPVYQERGYLKAAFGEPQPKVVKRPSKQTDEGPRDQTLVDVTFDVTPGQQYKLDKIAWSGNKEFPTEELEKMVRLTPGEPANTVRLNNNLQDVQKLYGSRGYVTATFKADAEYNQTAPTVILHIDVKEGPVYHMGELEFRGLDNSLTAKLRNAWKIRQGEVYDSTYLSDYLPAAQKLLPPSFDWDVASHVTANLRDKTVDVDLIYTVKAPK
jgi:outer membrane protein assembly factor BamA